MNNLSKSAPRFSYPLATLQQISRDILDHAKLGGATACECNVSDGFGQTVTVRQNEVETIEYNRDKGLSVTVYIGQKRGNASTSDFSPQAINDTVAAALSIARYTAEDDCAGLADPKLFAQTFPDLDLYHPWSLPVENAIELARKCEAAALAVDKRISNSEGASISLSESQFIYANSLGFMAGHPLSRQSVSCSVIAQQDKAMQRDYWYSVARDVSDLELIDVVGKRRENAPLHAWAQEKSQLVKSPCYLKRPLLPV